ncbi:MAG: signal recognition particle protein [Christensenellales bacterium]|uniref:Signal recognition particle protein n=1 Tax=Candidatus Avichristensenella intestinipullorum TaxID=2840693 RepID=A0A9D0YV72_9FIRM|nr:signal recognition particle protein [Christensenellales bacterium]HIQ62470.1 signal recognition particle protein [Candidatus Avichristensenella intestinipullorum]
MAFEGLTEKLQGALKKLSGRGKLSEQDVKAAMREVRMALLEADVNFLVAKDFVRKVSERCVGAEISQSLSPAQQVIKIVNEELTSLMGGANARLTWSSMPPTVFMLCGLQGAGKTTMAGKLARFLQKQGKKPLLVACDIYRPAAIKQLQVVGASVNVPVFEKGAQNPVQTAREAVEHARYYGMDTVILDTAGRLHIDEALMQELQQVRDALRPQEILLVVDAMTGQDAVTVANSFNEQLSIDGVILTKLDGDTRGGAALSVRAVTGKPIKFSGVSEKMDGIEPFYPDRMASRILGMGDMLSLIEKAQETFDEAAAEKLSRKARDASFTLEDYLEQMQQMKKMGSMESILKMLPGVGAKLKDVQIDENAMKKPEAIIRSMTPQERRHPEILNASRRRRIAAGSGTTVQDVNQMIRQFETAKQMMKQMMGGRFGKRRMRLPGM